MVKPIRSLLRRLDQKEIRDAVRVEARNRERHLPPISVYRWWARRTEAVNGALLEAAAAELRKDHLIIADPFAGGGIIPLSALLRGHTVYAQDLNPWVTQGLASMLTLPSKGVLIAAEQEFLAAAKTIATDAYETKFDDGTPAQISHSLRVAVARCTVCRHRHRMFPHALVSLTSRKEYGLKQAILACQSGHLFFGRTTARQSCPDCCQLVDPSERYLPGRIVTCPGCGHREDLETRARRGLWSWELVVVERSDGARRELSFPTKVERRQASETRWNPRRSLGTIPETGETRVLLRHGFHSWADIYPRRQRVVMEQSLRIIKEIADAKVRSAMTMALVGTAEMAGLLSRWDRYYLKSYESMASHRFNFTTLAVEPNVLGAGLHGRGTFRRRMRSFAKASDWNVANNINSKVKLYASDARRLSTPGNGRTTIVSGSSERMLLPSHSVDVILTDPPYHDDVQYHELSLPLRSWASLTRTRPSGEAVAIPHSSALSGHRAYRNVLQRIFEEFHRVLKSNGRLLFSYANREPAAWVNLFAALRAAEFKPIGYSIVHSENEIDLSKRNGRACNLDLILELAPKSDCPIITSKPLPTFCTDEERYLKTVGDAFLESFSLVNGWEGELVNALQSEIFVAALNPQRKAQNSFKERQSATSEHPFRQRPLLLSTNRLAAADTKASA